MQNEYLQTYKGGFYGILKWHELDALWQQLIDARQEWYVYQIGETVPQKTLSQEQFKNFIHHLDQLLHEEHEENYCGIVYVDNRQQPSFIKIYDPNHLGSSCGSSGAPPPLPGWTVSLSQPIDLQQAFPAPANRKRWWRKIFGG